MRYILQMTPSLIHGDRRERVRAVGAIGLRFALGAYLVATVAHYIDPYLQVDLSGSLPALIGGILFAAIAGLLKTA
jgi:hypothetical protein